MSRLSFAEYHARDYRAKCSGCGRWMRFLPTEKSPATRRDAPHAAHCTECDPHKQYPSSRVRCRACNPNPELAA